MSDRRPAACFDPREHVRDEMREAEINSRALSPTARSWYVGNSPMSESVAADLAEEFGTSPEFWLNLDRSWQRWKEANGGD